MASMSQLIAEHTSLAADDVDWLTAFVNEWHLLADTSFSDLILWVPDVDDNIFWAVAQTRPNTGPTALEDDVVGEQVAYDPEHLVTSAYLSQEICETSDNQLRAGIPVDVWAIPIVRGDDHVIGIVERHTNRMGVRAPGALEDAYLETADILSTMVWQATYPVRPPSDPSHSPKVGDGMILSSLAGIVSYATPNAVSAFRRMGWAGDLQGEDLRALTRSLVADQPQLGQTVSSDLTSSQVRELDLETRSATIVLRVVPLRDLSGPAGVMVLCRDTTDLRHRERALITKDATIREIHHRVKNNLQTVAALLRLQSRRIESEEGQLALKDAMSRVQAIAVVHEILSQAFDEVVAFDDVADRILRMVGDVAAAQGQVDARRQGSFGNVRAEMATPLSLVITELCQNAIEHGLHRSSGTVLVVPARMEGRLEVTVLDNGGGLPEGFEPPPRSLGLSIVRTLVTDMGGSFHLGNNPDGSGSRAHVVVPIAD
ncbi:sensor histidine kinase [Aestuariimicrobium ganziense]|uniref:sensor histidine kinase n=1 Tax=Aestuariimicrobium ganziense TaxID=2773677 RepID=UPI0019441F5F|nr:sensor histidine kinase [Aestuariimicrobium ganziense]